MSNERTFAPRWIRNLHVFLIDSEGRISGPRPNFLPIARDGAEDGHAHLEIDEIRMSLQEDRDDIEEFLAGFGVDLDSLCRSAAHHMQDVGLCVASTALEIWCSVQVAATGEGRYLARNVSIARSRARHGAELAR